MAVANMIEKEFFRFLKKNFLPSNSLCKIFNRNTIKLNHSTIPNVASLINKNNIKKLRNNQPTEPPKCNCTNKTDCFFKGKSHFECISWAYIVVDLTIVALIETLKKYM